MCRSRLSPLNKERCTRYGQAFPAQHIVASELRSVGGKTAQPPPKANEINLHQSRSPAGYIFTPLWSLGWRRVMVCTLFEAPPTFFVSALQLHYSGASSLKNNNKTHPTRVDLKLMNVLSFFFSLFQPPRSGTATPLPLTDEHNAP